MNKTDTLGDVIYQIARDHGEQTLTNTQLMLAMFMDIAPTLRKERELLRAFLMCDGASKLLQVRENPAADQKAAMEKMVKTLYDEQGIAEAAARQVCAAFYYGITGRIWGFDTPEAKHVPKAPSKSKSKSQKTKNLDVHTTAYVKNLQTHAGRNTTVNLDGETIHIQIPPNTVAGQECKFPGKGKLDPQTGSRGDLYVLVEIQNSRWPSGLKILAAAVVAVLLMLIGSLLFSPGDSDKGSGNSRNNADDAVVQGHIHQWRDATCEAPKTCVTCGATSGTKASHEWNSATYDEPETCKICGITRGQPLQDPEEQKKQQIMDQAETYVTQGKYRRAIQILDDAWEEYNDRMFYDAAAQYRQEFAIYNFTVIAAGKYNSVLRYADGMLLAVGDSSQNELDANYWTDTVMIGVGDRHTVALKKNGTVLVVGEDIQHGARSWENVIMVSAGDVHTVGLLKDGSVVAVGYSETDHNQGDVETLMQSAGSNRIVAVSAGHRQTLALLETGRVVSCGSNETGARNVTGWRDIAAIYTGTDYSAGLKTDGTVVVTRSSWDVSDWTDIVTLAAGDYYLLGLKEDGTVLAVGKCGSINVSGWENIVHIAAGNDHAVAVDKDGNVFCTGSNKKGQCFEKETNIND